MSITVAAVRVPYYSPYQKPTLDTHSSGGESSSSKGTKSHRFQVSLDFQTATPSKPHRWSQNPVRGESTAEEQQMSNNGTASGLPLREGAINMSTTSAPPTPSHAPVNLPPFSRDANMDNQPGHAYDLPPPRRRSPESAYGTERRPSRSFGVHSILNPPQSDEGEKHVQRRSAAQMDEESRLELYPPGSLAPLSRPPSSSSVGTDETSATGATGPRVVRRILTPISPRLHRTASFSRIATGTIDATESPFLSPVTSRIHTQEPGTGGIPPLPMVHSGHVAQRPPFTMPSAPTPPLAPSTVPRRASVSVVYSARASPSPSYSSFSQSGHASPAHLPLPSGSGPTPPGSYRLAPSPVVGSLRDVPHSPLDGDPQDNNFPVVSSGQNYQLLTIDTTRGQTQLPVEVQAASRMADEKRKRNAGASARFRARRKMKEREASSKIAILEQDLQFAREDSEHYKRERDYLLDIFVRTVPHHEGYLRERPKSPRIGRVVRDFNDHDGMMSTGEDSPAPTSSIPLSLDRYERFEPRYEGMERERREEGERQPTRRRTETFPLTSPTSTGPRSFASSPFPTFAPQQSHMHAESHFRSPGPGSGGTSTQQLSSRPPSGPEQQYRVDQSYGRSWHPPR
jgi:hypothetical protein